MLKGLSPLLTPDLLHALASAGHGDAIAIVDANFPAAALAKRLVTLAGITAPAALDAVLSVLPVDDAEPDPVRVMRDPAGTSEPARDFATILERRGLTDPAALDRQAFYQAAAAAFVVIQTGERRFYGNILLIKGVLPPDARL
jgi:L-fucose mutarotase